jgi:hypothetical protein
MNCAIAAEIAPPALRTKASAPKAPFVSLSPIALFDRAASCFVGDTGGMEMRRLFIAFAALAAMSGSAMANCYEIIGCDDSEYFSRPALRQLSCQALWEVRNLIYQQNGYCFQTERAKQVFDNSGCWITDQAAVRLNVYERANVTRIVEIEKARGCT